jgi:hypothetical protein
MLRLFQAPLNVHELNVTVVEMAQYLEEVARHVDAVRRKPGAWTSNRRSNQSRRLLWSSPHDSNARASIRGPITRAVCSLMNNPSRVAQSMRAASATALNREL